MISLMIFFLKDDLHKKIIVKKKNKNREGESADTISWRIHISRTEDYHLTETIK